MQNIAENILLNFVICTKSEVTSGFCLNKKSKQVNERDFNHSLYY